MHSSDHTYDIAIVGGGLAGLTLAIQAVDAGYSVILFEKERYPFHKVCGEYISMESYDFLVRCGVPLATWNLPFISTLQLTDCTGKSFEFALPLGGFGVSRYKLDHTLAAIAKQKGVQLYEQTKVDDVLYQDDFFQIKSSGKIYQSKLVAGAFGKRSNLDIKWQRAFSVRKKSRLNNYIGVKYHVNYDFPDNLIALHNFKHGYCGISRIEDGKSCICYLTTAENLQRTGNSIEGLEQTLLAANKALLSIFSNADFLYEKPLTISQVSFDRKAQVENHILMLGDAAGLITPLCGNGMSMAMQASYLVFQQIQLFLGGTISRVQMEKQYTTIWKQSFSRRLAIGRLVQRCFGHPFLTSCFLYSMSKLPWLANWMIRQTHGKPF